MSSSSRAGSAVFRFSFYAGPDAGGAGLIRGPVQLPFELSLRHLLLRVSLPYRTSSGERRERSDRLYTDYREPRATLANWRDPHTP